MKTPAFVAPILVSCVALAASGCAVFTKGTKQSVVVRSTPAGASTAINGTEVGATPYRVKLPREGVYRVDFQKPGYAPNSALFLSSTEAYDKRFLRWGIDYDLGAAVDLVPEELVVTLTPAMGDIVLADRFEEMAAQITRADAMLAAGQISAADHKELIAQITASYHSTLP